MAVKKTTTTTRKNSFIKESEPVVANNNTETVKADENMSIETSKKTVKKFSPDDLILCQSLCVGQTFVKGFKSGVIYTFEALGAEEYIEYRDLVAAVRSKDSFLFINKVFI